MTERTGTSFSLKRGADENAFIAVEPIGEALTIQESGFISFELNPDLTIGELEELERFLNRNLVNICFTRYS